MEAKRSLARRFPAKPRIQPRNRRPGGEILHGEPPISPYAFRVYNYRAMEDKSFIRMEKPTSIPEGWENKVSRRRILVVDDDDDIRRFNAEALTGSGYHVDAAVDGAQG